MEATTGANNSNTNTAARKEGFVNAETKHSSRIDIFTNNKFDDFRSLGANNVASNMFLLLDITDDGFASLLNEARNEVKDNVKFPNDKPIGQEIRDKFNANEAIRVGVVSVMGEESIAYYEIVN